MKTEQKQSPETPINIGRKQTWTRLYPYLGPDNNSEKNKLGPDNNSTVYIYAVKLKTGPMFALFKLKTGPFLFVFVFFIFENLILPAERKRIFEKPAKNTISKVKNWSNYVAQHTWTSF